VQTPFPTDKLVAGTASVASVVFNKSLTWRTGGNFQIHADELSLTDTSCNVDEGTATGALDVKIAEQDSPFVLDTTFSGVILDRLLTDAGVAQVEASGTLSGFVHLEGIHATATRRRAGAGSF